MAEIKVRFFATVREVAGVPEILVSASDLGELVDSLGIRFGRRMKSLLASTEKGEERVVVLVNGRNVQLGRDRGFQLKDGDEVAFFPPVSGG